MIYYSMLLSIIVISYLIIKRIKLKKNPQKIFIFLVCILVIIFQGFRSFNVGIDLKRYIIGYIQIGKNTLFELTYQNYEFGYVILNKILYNIGLNKRMFVIFISSIIQIPIFYTIYKYSKNCLLSILWYFSLGNFIMTFSGLRQSIAMAICFSSYYFIKKKKYFLFIMTILFASAFHLSALFCLLLYPIYYIKLNKNRIVLIVFFEIFLFIFREKIFIILTTLLYGKAKEIIKTNSYTVLIIYILLFLISLRNKKVDQEYSGLRNISILLMFIYSFASVFPTATRLGFPLTLYMSLYIPKLLLSFKIKPYKLYIGILYLILIVFFYFIIGGLGTLPFSFGNEQLY